MSLKNRRYRLIKSTVHTNPHYIFLLEHRGECEEVIREKLLKTLDVLSVKTRSILVPKNFIRGSVYYVVIPFNSIQYWDRVYYLQDHDVTAYKLQEYVTRLNEGGYELK